VSAYSEEIVFTPSEDQRAQVGVLMRPSGGAARSIGIVSIHGATGFFYLPVLVNLGRALAQEGYRFVSGNTRGHDVAAHDFPWSIVNDSRLTAETLAQYRLGGGGWARWDEEPYDVAGWIDFLMAQGAEQIVLLGHSLGVMRITYYQALRQDPRIVGLILASGADSVTATDPDRIALAERLVAEGQEEALLPAPAGSPMGFGMESAAYVVHWENHVGRFAAEGHTPWIASIRVPVLATGGTADDRIPALHAALDDMRGRAVQVPRFDVRMFEGADHDYSGQVDELGKVVVRWIETLRETRGPGRRRWWSRGK
jgi:pimeloyl-ACP methyl ester carboxylesterase